MKFLELDVQLHSLDTYNLSVHGNWWFGAGQHVAELGPNKEISARELKFRVNAIGSADAYATINGRKDGKHFWWRARRYTAEFTPKETGFYTVYAYLYDGWTRIGHKTETIYAQKQ